MKVKNKCIIILLLIGMIMLLSSNVGASENYPSNYNGEEKVILKGEVIEKDLYTSGSRVKNEGLVKGDLIAASYEFENIGEVQRDLILAAQFAQISGEIKGDFRIAALDLKMDGKVNGNSTIIASTFLQSSKGTIGGSAVGFAEEGEFNGTVNGDIRGSYETLIVNASVKGDIRVNAGELILGPKAKIEGNVFYTSDINLSEREGSQVLGRIVRKDPPVIKKNLEIEKTFEFVKWIFRGIGLLSILLMGAILSFVVPNKTKELGEMIQRRPLYVIGVGIVGLIVIPVLSIFSLITIIGIPLGIILLAFYLLLLYLGKLVLGIWLGQRILNKEKSPIYHVLLGTLIISILGFLPYVGFIVKFASVILGIGAILLSLYESWRSTKNNSDQ